MRIILNNCEDPVKAVQIAIDFNSDFPAPHKDCLYRDNKKLMTYVRRTKSGLSVKQWRD